MNKLAKNFLWGVGFVIVVVLGVRIALVVTTLHGRSVPVPDFTGKTVEQSRLLAEKSDMKIVVVDSVFVSKVPRGTTYRQNPLAGTNVKKGRTVYLTVNAVGEKRVVMPNLVGLSLRQAKSELLSGGFDMGELIYESDIATNNVLRQLFCGETVEPGTLLPSDSVIDLVLGRSDADALTNVPTLIGKRREKAVDAAKEGSFNIGHLSFDTTVKTKSDSLMAFVYRQWPKEGETALMGTRMTLYLTMDPMKVIVEEPKADSTTVQ